MELNLSEINYVKAEKEDFRMDKLNYLIYMGNYEGIEYIELDEELIDRKISYDFMFGYPSSKLNYKIKGVKSKNTKLQSVRYMFSSLELDYLNLFEFEILGIKSFHKMFFEFNCDELILPKNITKLPQCYIKTIFHRSNVKIMYCHNEEFVKLNKDFFRDIIKTDLRVIKIIS